MVNFLFYLLFLFFSLGMLGRISFLDQQINGYGYELIMLLILFFLIAQKRLDPLVKAYKKNPYIFWFFLFILSSFFIGIKNYTPAENFVSFLYQIRLFFYFIFFFYVGSQLPKKVIEFFIVITAVISLAQYFFYADLRNLIYQGWDPHLFRMFGTYLDTYVAVSIYGLIFFYLLFQKKTLLTKILLFCYLLFIVMTFSRLGYLAFLATLFLVFLKDIKKFLVLALIGFVILFLLPKPWGEGVHLTRIFSINSRLLDYQKAVGIWQKSPIFGIGYNRIRYLKKDFVSHAGASFHSSFMIILATSGIFGLSLFLLALSKLAKTSTLSAVYLIFISLISLGDNSLLHPFVLFLLLSLIGFSLSRKQL